MDNFVNIADVCSEIFAGGDAPKSNMSATKTDEYKIPIFSNGEADNGLYGYTNFARVTKPSITVSARGTIGFVAVRNEPFVPIVRLISLTPNPEKIELKYLYYAIQNYKFDGSGTSIPQLTVPMLKKYSFPLPTKEQQLAVIDQLDNVCNLISLRKQQLAKLDELVKSRFIEMFGEVETNVKGFPMKQMDECCRFIGGAQPDKSHFEYEKTDDNIRLIQIRDYKSDRFITYIPKSLARKTCTAADIMIGRYGPPIFQILGGIEGAYNVALMKAVPTAEFNTEYFRYFLKSEKLLHYLESFSQRTAGQDGIQIDKLNAYPCFVPPIELQNQFAAFVEQIDKSKYVLMKFSI